MRILVVEDQPDIFVFHRRRRDESGYFADCVGTLGDAIEALKSFDYPVMLLDRRLPDGDGVSALPEIRAARPGVRVLLVTAMHAIDDRIGGLDAGADDYLTKPFEIDELLARLRVSLRRPCAAIAPCIALGALTFDPTRWKPA